MFLHPRRLPFRLVGAFCVLVFILYVTHWILLRSLVLRHNYDVCSRSIAAPSYALRKQTVGRPFTEFDARLAEQFNDLLGREGSAQDAQPGLVDLARQVMDEPAKHHHLRARTHVETPQARAVKDILKNMTGGFFVECGASDGETASNTLGLERTLGWTGLLVEMDPHLYTQLLGRNRNVHSINACLSIANKPMMVNYTEPGEGGGRILPATKPLQASSNGTTWGQSLGKQIPCFPLNTLLLALGRTRVNFLSLDVEGFELDVLRTVDFAKVQVDVLSVEYKHISEGKEACRKYMGERGYQVYKDLVFKDAANRIYVNAFIFVKKGLKIK